MNENPITAVVKKSLDAAFVRGVMVGAKTVIESLRAVVPRHAQALGGVLRIEELFELLDEAEQTICGAVSNDGDNAQ